MAPLSDLPGDETLLSRGFLEHFAGADEPFVVEAPADDALDALHGEHQDPWGTESRWYEQRKRDLVLAVLPRRSFDRALDVGCSTGTLTAALAPRCRQLVGVDSSPAALGVARERLRASAGVQVRELDVPSEWPEGAFDLVVVSESGYFLSPVALDALTERIARSLTPDGCLVLAHWRHPIDGWPRSGPDVHAAFAAAPGMPGVVARYDDRDVQIVVHAAPEALPDPGAQD